MMRTMRTEALTEISLHFYSLHLHFTVLGCFSPLTGCFSPLTVWRAARLPPPTNQPWSAGSPRNGAWKFKSPAKLPEHSAGFSPAIKQFLSNATNAL
jgi:hypothetical protein